MLKNIPKNISPDLLKILAEMGHGDEIVLADGNFPAASNAKRLVRADGLDVLTLLEDILTLFPLDTYVEHPITLMDTVLGDPTPTIWQNYYNTIAKHEPNAKAKNVERFEFYQQAKNAYAIVATTETALYANIILKKGVVKA